MVELATSREAVLRRQVWLSQIRTGCIMVSGQPSYLVSSTSLTQRFPEASAQERRELLVIADNLAREYGLLAETEADGPTLSVRLVRPSRSAASPQLQAPEQPLPVEAKSHRGLVGAFFRLLGMLSEVDIEPTPALPPPSQPTRKAVTR